MKFEKQLKALKKLNLPKEEYTIFGSGPMAIRGIRDSNDLDVLVTKKLFRKLLQKYPQDTSKHPFGCLIIGNIEIGNQWQGDKEIVDQIINDSEEIEGLPFVKLDRVIEFKKNYKTEKNDKDLQLIQEYLDKQQNT